MLAANPEHHPGDDPRGYRDGMDHDLRQDGVETQSHHSSKPGNQTGETTRHIAAIPTHTAIVKQFFDHLSGNS